MAIAERLAALLPRGAGQLLIGYDGNISEIRLRADKPVQIVGDAGEAMSESPLGAAELHEALTALMKHSVYAHQEELDRGFFTLEDGSRVGVCGRMYSDGTRARMGDIGSACVRVAREYPGCADALIDEIDGPEGIRSTLILSPPGMGKTTMLRDIARQLSERGHAVAVSDGRHELAACREGVPTLDVGPRTDVLDGFSGPEAVIRMVRTMSPRVIVADEIGDADDALALSEAARCGVAVVASAHASGVEAAMEREGLRAILRGGVIQRVALLGPGPGGILEIRRMVGRGNAPWICA